MSAGSGRVLTRELFEVIKAEIYGRLGGTIQISDVITSEDSPHLQIFGMCDGKLYPDSMRLSTSDIIVYKSNLLGAEHCITNFNNLFIYVAIDIEALLKMTTSIQLQKKRVIVYFNGFDRTEVGENLSKLNNCEHLVMAIWINSSERTKLREAALFHNFKKAEVRASKAEVRASKAEAHASKQDFKVESLCKENSEIRDENLVIHEQNALLFEENKVMGSKITALEAEIAEIRAENAEQQQKLNLVLERLGMN